VTGPQSGGPRSKVPISFRLGLASNAYALGAILLWASLASALYISLGTLAPQQILTFGMGIAGVALMGWDWARGKSPRHTWPGLSAMALGLYGIFGYHALLVGAFAFAPPVQANVLNYTWPLWILLLGARASGRKFGGRLALGGTMGLVGTIVALEPWRAEWASTPRAWVGYGLALSAGFCWGSFTVLLHRRPPSEPVMGWWCVEAALVSAAWMLAGGVPFALDLHAVAVLSYIGFLPLGAAFALWETATQRSSLSTLGLLSYLTPPLSTLVLGWVSGHAATAWAWLGLALVLGGALVGKNTEASRA
jgi:drug/metabolite transporter (DMT)-like permease